MAEPVPPTPWLDDRGHQVRSDEAVRALHDCLEDLFNAVWDGEADWRFNDRLDLAVRPSRFEIHRCALPASPSAGLVFNCPVCGQQWVRGHFAQGDFSVWMPS